MAEATQGYLEITDEAGQKRQVPLTTGSGGRMILGRSPDVQVPLPSQTVSRQHAELFTDPFGRWWIKDLGSRNGTLVNGRKVEEHLLNPNDSIAIEQFVVVYRVTGQQAVRSRSGVGLRSGGSGATILSVSDAPMGKVTRLDQLESPKIDAIHLKQLTQLSSQLLATEPDDDRLNLLCGLMVDKTFHGTSAMAFRLDKRLAEPQPEMLCAPHSGTNWRKGEEPYISRTLLRGVRQNEAPVVASNVASGGQVMALSLAGNVREMAAVACPIGNTPEVLDVLYVTFPAEYGTGEWLALAALAAEQYQQANVAWVARRKAQEQAILEKELHRASQIQGGLIPKKINIPGLEVALGFEPCKWVGGDYVDIRQTEDGRIYMIICDVCGKGMQAAIVTASLHCMFHLSVTASVPLANLMERFNGYLETALPDESFVTAICVIYDPKTGRLELSNAGHPPAMIVSPDGKARDLGSGNNPPLGYIPVPFDMETHELKPGDMLGLFTDGLTESANEQDAMLGIAGVANMLERVYPGTTGKSIAAAATDLTNLLNQYEGKALRADDRTFMLVRRT
ncbi:MAG: SpoIIE family protein phosphatase [Phycisphaeraceae bacterium]|nr:SpoIIE family protein phosphatase [Phycisphaeraceae bacterium]